MINHTISREKIASN